jgi:exopolysaccharide biosynthesis polyprenyl glycosylphosphotransferase
VTTAELSAAAQPRLRGGARVLNARRLLEFLTVRLAPSAAAGLIAYSHMSELGEALVVFTCMLVATQAVDTSRLPLHLMPVSRVLMALVAVVVGALGAWLIAAVEGKTYPLSEYEVVVLGGWLVLALGAWVRSWLQRGIGVRVAVIGARDFTADFAAELAAAGVEGYEVLGWIGGDGPSEYRRMRRLGGLDEVRATVVNEGVDLLVCGPPIPEFGTGTLDDICARVAPECIDLPVRLIAANQLYEEVLGHVPVGTIDAAWYRYIMHPRFHPSAPLSKRAFDLLLGGLMALVFLPVVAAAAAAIKLVDGGPVFYRQRRLGEYGRPFEIVKLRTMRMDAESDGPRWASAADARITPVGRILRRFHLDEVPQLWNVLKGEMTLVGPRPERPEIVAELERKFPHYTRRHLVKPGIAGWAALRCGYAGSELGTAWKLCHDLFYVKRRSVLVDALILAETAVEVFRDAHRVLDAPGERFLVGEHRASG